MATLEPENRAGGSPPGLSPGESSLAIHELTPRKSPASSIGLKNRERKYTDRGRDLPGNIPKAPTPTPATVRGRFTVCPGPALPSPIEGLC